MTKTTYTIVSIIVLVAVLVVGFALGSVGGKSSQTLGSVTYDRSDLSGGVRIGMNGSYINAMLTGTCNLVGVGSDTIAANSNRTATCAATGVRSGDKVDMRLPFVTGASVVIAGATASTTANDVITVNLLDASTTASQVTKIGTSTSYFIMR